MKYSMYVCCPHCPALQAETCSEVRGGWLHRLLDAPASQGGGAAACLRFLRSLGPCAMAAAAHAMRLERRVPPRLLVVHLMLHKLNPPPSPEDARRLRRMQLGLQALQVRRTELTNTQTRREGGGEGATHDHSPPAQPVGLRDNVWMCKVQVGVKLGSWLGSIS